MRLAAKVDVNQKEIVAAFRKFGCSVLMLHTVGSGCPDILVAKCKRNILIEIKDGRKPLSARALTKDEQKFHESWRGDVRIVESLGDVINVVKLLET